MNYRCYQITLQWNICTHIGAVRSVDRLFIAGAPVWRWLGEYVTLGRTFYRLLLKQEVTVAAAQLLPHFVYWKYNVIIRPWINYTIILIICINNNNETINNNCGKLQDITSLFKIPTGTRKHFFEIYRQFGHMPSKRFASPDLDTCQMFGRKITWSTVWCLSGFRPEDLQLRTSVPTHCLTWNLSWQADSHSTTQKKSLRLYGTQRFITVLTTAWHWTPSLSQSEFLHPILI